MLPGYVWQIFGLTRCVLHDFWCMLDATLNVLCDSVLGILRMFDPVVISSVCLMPFLIFCVMFSLVAIDG